MKRKRGLGRGLGVIYQRGETWWIQYSVRGVRHRESVGSIVLLPDNKTRPVNRADAVNLLKKRIGEVQAGKLVGNAVEKTTLGDLTKMLADDYAANKRHSSVAASVAHLHDFFGAEARAIDITSDRITAYRAQRQGETWAKRPVASATINYELAMLRRAFKLAARAGKVSSVPEFDMLVIDNARQGFFEREQFNAVREHLPAYLKPVIETLYLTGWRRGEVLSRQWQHVDFAKGWLRLEPGQSKNKQGRMFPLTAEELRAVLETQRERVREIERETGAIIPWVFVRDDGSQIVGLRKAWATACKNAGVGKKLIHDFRRTAVRNLERSGVSRSAAMKMTGHLTESVYRRYAIVSESDLIEAGGKLAALHAADRKLPGTAAKVIQFKGAKS